MVKAPLIPQGGNYMSEKYTAPVQKIWSLLNEVYDPEIPVLSVIDLGIILDVTHAYEITEITITPTYSGCPAMDAISMDIRLKLLENGFKNIKVTSVLSPVWTTDSMSEEGKRKLNEYGIAPPQRMSEESQLPHCPQCNSADTKLLSQFGSTSCKALFQCNDCKEPFDQFKCH